MKKTRTLFLLAMLTGALIPTAKAQHQNSTPPLSQPEQSQAKNSHTIPTPPPVCEGTSWDTADLRRLCLANASNIPDTTIYQWYYLSPGSTRQQPYPNRWTPTNGCRIVVQFNDGTGDIYITDYITVWSKARTTISVTRCDSYRWPIAGEMGLLTNSGIYEHVASNADPVHGCDSIYSLHLTIKHSTESSLEIDSCDRYTWHVGTNNNTYTESGTHTDTLGNAVGCDSVVRLYLTIRNSTHNAVIETVCDEYTWHGSTYRQSGTQLFSYTNAANCPSMDTLHLTINPSSHNAYSVDICDRFTWNWGDDSITFTLGGNYTRNYLNAYGCYSTDTLHLNIRRSTSAVFPVTDCNSYTWHGTEYTASNYTATHTEPNSVGCDSVTTLNLTIHYSNMTGSETVTACDRYSWHNQIYTQSGNYPYSTYTTHNCDSLCTLHLTINYSGEEEITVTACDQFIWKGNTYIYSGNYQFDTTTTYGCDSTIIFHLTIRNSSSAQMSVDSCDQYTWNGTTYTQGGSYTYSTTNRAGCDSTITLSLNIRRSTSAVFSATSCDSYTWHGTWYTASNNTATYISTNAVGCDSVTTLNLTIHYSDLTGSESVTACDSYRWHNQTYTESGDYPYSTRTTHNCDSLCTLHLTVHYSGEEEISATACEQYVWKGNNYIYSGDYRLDTTTTNGCDSTVILHLTIHYGTHNTEYQNVCESYEWHDSVYTTEGIHIFAYQNEYDCKSTDTLHLTVYGARVPQARDLVLKNLGTKSPQMIVFPREQGEDEYAYEWYRDDAPIQGANKQYYRFTEADKGTHVFSVHASPIEQKRCYSVSDTTLKVRLHTIKQLSATPNPNNGVFTLTLTTEDEQAQEVSIYNAQGNCVSTVSAEVNNISIRQALPRGIYMVRVTTDKGNVYTEKIVIN